MAFSSLALVFPEFIYSMYSKLFTVDRGARLFSILFVEYAKLPRVGQSVASEHTGTRCIDVVFNSVISVQIKGPDRE